MPQTPHVEKHFTASDTVRDIVIHQAGTAEELARVLGAHLAAEPVSTRSFEERERPPRALNDEDLWTAVHDRMADLNEITGINAAVQPTRRGSVAVPDRKPWAACAGY